MRYTRLFTVFGLVVSAALYSQAQTTIAHQISLPAGVSWCDDSATLALFNTINKFRGEHGLPALQTNTLATAVAETRAVDVSAYLQSHSPGEAGFNPHQNFYDTIGRFGYNAVGENLAYFTGDTTYIVYSLWQDSLHLAALLNSSANVAGVACVASSGTPFWVYDPGVASGATTPVPSPSPSPSPTPTPTPTPAPTPTPTPTGLDAEQSSFLQLINQFRAQNGVGPLQVSATLQQASQWMSTDMANNGYVSHTDSLGRSTASRLASFGYTYSPWGENIAAGYSDAQNALNGLANACDPDASGNCTFAHRKNMLNAGFNAIGIGRAYNANSPYGWYWTTDFGGVVDQPLSSTPTPTPTPTPAPQPAPVISSFVATPSSVSAGTAVTLSWSVSGATAVTIDNGVGDVTGVQSRIVAPNATTTYTLTASNGSGSVKSTVTINVTASSGSQQPSAPSLVSAVAKSATQVDLQWTAPANSAPIWVYQVNRNNQLLAYVPGGTLTYSDTGVTAGQTYSYSVIAYSALGFQSAPSNTIQVTPSTGSQTPSPTPSPTQCGAPATDSFTACYYNNATLSGSPVLVRTDPYVNFAWGAGTPAPQVTSQQFSVRWQGQWSLSQGTYIFSVLASDGVRLYVDGNLIIDSWQDQAMNTHRAMYTFSADGPHLIVMEYYSRNGNATAGLSAQGPYIWQNN